MSRTLAVFALFVCLLATSIDAQESTVPIVEPAGADQQTAIAAEGRKPAWYEDDPWPLIGSVLTIVAANSIAIWLVYLQSSRSFNALLRQRKIEQITSSLNDFYNPLLALIEINGEIFSKTGPRSFPEGHIEREAAARVWAETKKKILANNSQIENILKTKLHLMQNADSINEYKALLMHVAMYETFQVIESDRYAAFQFPTGVAAHIRAKRAIVLDELHAATGEQV